MTRCCPAVAAHLARHQGRSRAHTASDLAAYLRWLQEVRHLRPSTVSRRLPVLATFYRSCVTDQIFDHSPTEFVRRPHVLLESPTLGLSHLQFEAILTAGRDSTDRNDFALVAMLGCSASACLRQPARTSMTRAMPRRAHP